MKILTTVALFSLIVGCKQEALVIDKFSGSLDASSSDQLEYVEHETITPATNSNLDGHPQNTPPGLVGSAFTSDLTPVAVSDVSSAPTLESNVQTYVDLSAGGIHDGTENLSLSLTKTMQGFTNGLILTCETKHSFVGLPTSCDTESVNTITRSSLQTGTISFSLSNNKNGSTIKSAALSSKRWAIKQISNTSGNQATTDDLKGFYVNLGDHFIFIGATPSGGRKIFSVDEDDRVDQVSNTRRDQALHDITDGYYSNLTMKFKDKFLFMMENVNGVKKLSTIDSDRNINYVVNITGNLATADTPYPLEETYSGLTTNILDDEYYMRFAPGGASRVFKIKSDWSVQQVSNIFGSGDSVWMGTAFNGNYYFRCAVTALNQQKYCRTTSDGKVKVLTNLKNNMALADVPAFIMPAGNYLYLSMEPTTGVKKLYRLDTNDNFEQVSNTSENQAVTDNIAGGVSANRVIIPMNDCLYFSANNANGAQKLYKVCDDGVVKQVLNTSGDQTVSDAYGRMDRKTFSDRIHIVARNPQGGKKLYVLYSDDRSQQISNTIGNQAVDDEINASGNFLTYKDEFYFVAKNPQGGRKLFKQKASGKVVQVSNIRGDQTLPDFGSTNWMTVWKDALYFDGVNSNGVAKMFKLYLKD